MPFTFSRHSLGTFIEPGDTNDLQQGIETVTRGVYNVCEPANSPQSGDYARGDGVTDDSGAFATADANNAGNGVTYVPPGTYRIGASKTLAHAFRMAAGAMFSVDAGVTLTLLGPGAVPRTQFVGGAGTVVFAKGVLPHGMYPEHFGGKPDWNGTTGTDNRAAIDKMLATGYGHYRLSAGNYAVKTADANGNGITLPDTADSFSGAAYALTTITVLCPVTWGVKSTAAQQRIHDFIVAVGTGGSATYGVGLSTAAVGSAESCVFSDVLVGTAGTGTLVNGFAVGPDNPGSSSMDLTPTFVRCRSESAGNASYLIGNGTAGNILLTTMLNCEGNHSQYVVYAAKAPFTWRDGATSQGGQTADFCITGEGGEVTLVDGHRSETSFRLFSTDGVVNSNFTTTISNTVFEAQNMSSDGQWISYQGGGTLKLDNVACLHQPTAVTPVIVVTPNTTTPINVVANGVSQAAPVASALLFRAGGIGTGVLTGYNQLDAATGGIVTATTALAVVGTVGGISAGVLGSGLSVKEGSGGKQGTATLTAGAVTVANTAVTANSRVFLTAQDGNTTGALRVSARTAGTSFTITSSNSSDTGVVAYEIFEPA